MLIAMLAAAAVSAGQFDLKCSGDYFPNVVSSDDHQPFTRVYSVDLDRGVWVDKGEDGQTVSPARNFHKVTDTELVFADNRQEDMGGVRRDTGSYDFLHFNERRKGSCVKATFSGIAQNKF